jgi:excisionase family DNA binding protein
MSIKDVVSVVVMAIDIQILARYFPGRPFGLFFPLLNSASRLLIELWEESMTNRPKGHNLDVFLTPPLKKPASPLSSQLGEDDGLLTVAEAARILRISRAKLYSLMSENRLPYYNIDRSRRIGLGDIRKFLSDCRRGQ